MSGFVSEQIHQCDVEAVKILCDAVPTKSQTNIHTLKVIKLCGMNVKI